LYGQQSVWWQHAIAKMGLSLSEVVTPFLGALQASVSVLLTIFIGVIIAQFGLLDGDASKQVSRTGVQIFLPALLITKVGSQLNAGTVSRYVPILIWALIYNLLTMAFGVVCTRLFKLPPWVTPALTFNNTTSLPLLLFQSLRSTGILQAVLVGNDTASAAIERAESYFLVNAMISNSLTFALGPRLLKPHDEDEPKSWSNSEAKVDEIHPGSNGYPYIQREEDAENAPVEGPDDHDDEHGEQRRVNEQSSLLPRRVVHAGFRASDMVYARGKRSWNRMPRSAQEALEIVYAFANPPLLGAVLGAVIGLVPALHRLFFADSDEGGYFNAWLTEPVKNVGGLFATLQVLVVGVKLSQSLRKMKQGEDSGRVPWPILGFVSFIRFIIWPA
jgi:auxin efflux carrier family protein